MLDFNNGRNVTTVELVLGMLYFNNGRNVTTVELILGMLEFNNGCNVIIGPLAVEYNRKFTIHM